MVNSGFAVIAESLPSNQPATTEQIAAIGEQLLLLSRVAPSATYERIVSVQSVNETDRGPVTSNILLSATESVGKDDPCRTLGIAFARNTVGDSSFYNLTLQKYRREESRLELEHRDNTRDGIHRFFDHLDATPQLGAFARIVRMARQAWGYGYFTAVEPIAVRSGNFDDVWRHINRSLEADNVPLGYSFSLQTRVDEKLLAVRALHHPASDGGVRDINIFLEDGFRYEDTGDRQGTWREYHIPHYQGAPALPELSIQDRADHPFVVDTHTVKGKPIFTVALAINGEPVTVRLLVDTLEEAQAIADNAYRRALVLPAPEIITRHRAEYVADAIGRAAIQLQERKLSTTRRSRRP